MAQNGALSGHIAMRAKKYGFFCRKEQKTVAYCVQFVYVTAQQLLFSSGSGSTLQYIQQNLPQFLNNLHVCTKTIYIRGNPEWLQAQ